MNKIWIVIANACIANVYSVTEKNRQFNLVKTLFHSESKLKNSELGTDSPGPHQETTHKSLEVEKFAKEICHELEAGRTHNAFTGVIIVAEPHFYGLINKYSNRHVQDKIKHHLAKDYTHFSTKKLKAELEEILAHEIRILLIS